MSKRKRKKRETLNYDRLVSKALTHETTKELNRVARERTGWKRMFYASLGLNTLFIVVIIIRVLWILI